jgi:hypothetical protein
VSHHLFLELPPGGLLEGFHLLSTNDHDLS